MSFASLVSEHLAGLSPAEARVAMFMADHPHSVGHLSAARLAEAADASDATVIRTVRKLGFDGLAALREALAAELSLSGRLEASLGNGRQVGTMRLIGERADAVRALPGRIVEDSLLKAVDIASKAKRVCVVGFGPGGFLAGYAAHQFRRAGIPATAMTATGQGFADELSRLTEGDAVVAMAYDRTREVDVLLDQAVTFAIPVIQLTEDALTADPRATVVLGAGRGEPTHSPTHATTIIVLESLVLAVAARHAKRADRATKLLSDLRGRLTGSQNPGSIADVDTPTTGR
ncbi:MurR/RpiR family transcriptional regulator [Gordonia sp. (in: high G+C Gram-positive bacteria)]|jgi:DNA-binding MurR/RpiR family transcriptional regulator|uniref:MurR/RpiR family transcriptional regulator n=2 Tax=Gordonia sp. (in: high G+C Gram-positive bacteria) TaxID=84139 RepID=UPI001D71E2E3|nr:MurR/RpiR family transcriptional regulator [Gordonia sp. (in: high G+C Gram-positive bacteria)]MCB1296460.1 MurR/RpiR family transcriptional regulator [Gordonia sp. (in: high G+C Gram-positive bacteria)]HMS74291.1 MurR/RpiR family transcriptional regulator [Gordonia sp. (in: high G+C Gram-positive bacteria)]